MSEHAPAPPAYLLGHSEQELQRLTLQAGFYLPLTRQLFTDAGIVPGMRVLDFGCGAGDSTFLVSELVGSTGHVIGVDAAPGAVALATARAAAAQISNVRFVAGNESVIAELAAEGLFDGVTSRLVLMYQPAPATTLAALVAAVRPGGSLAVQELNVASLGVSFPEVPLLTTIWRWMLMACDRAKVELNMGFKLHGLFAAAGLDPTVTLQARVEGAADSAVFDFAAETVRTLLPLIERLGIATAAEVDVDTLAARLRAETLAAGAVIAPSFLAGAWARR